MYASFSADICAMRKPVSVEVAVVAEQPWRRGKEEEKLSGSQKHEARRGGEGVEHQD